MKGTENPDAIVDIRNVSKIYHSYSKPSHRMLELLSGGRKQYARETRALDDGDSRAAPPHPGLLTGPSASSVGGLSGWR